MSVGLQIGLAFIAWFFVVITPLGPLGYQDRALPAEKRRGVSIFPGWPLLPLLFLAPMPLLGGQHLVTRIISWLHAVLLVGALAYLAYWIVRGRRAG
jgi:hypothetical protein